MQCVPANHLKPPVPGTHRSRFFMSKRIPLTQGQYAIVDDEDFEWLSLWKWYCDSGCYAARRLPSSEGGKIMPMHRQIMGNPPGLLIDHANRNGLDNRRVNLRLANKSLNCANQSLNTVRGLPRGVKKRGNSYGVRIRVNDKEHWLGSFNNPKDAARAYNHAAIKYFGEFACLNPI